MNILGIIGGMGPMATKVLYERITERTEAACDQEHIDMIILSHASMPDRTEAIRSGDTDRIKALLAADAQFLEKSGASAIAIPCNTSHYFLEELQEYVKIPIINMVHETVKYVMLHKPEAKRIGILATDGTVFAGLYKKECEALGLECFTPAPKYQSLVMSIIYEQIKKGLDGSAEDFAAIDAHLKENGCQAAVLACTELSCFSENHEVGDFYTDALNILCDRAIEICGGKVRPDIL